ncbi:MAG: YhdP family protein [Gammaproteobacteria bacterium]
MRWLLHFRVFIIICLAVVLISAAVTFSVIRAALPYATDYKNEIQQEISQQIGLPVEINSIDAAIHGFSPRLKLIGVSVFDKKNKVPLFNFQEAFVELDVLASIIRREVIIDDVGLVGADISIEKLSDNEWMIQGIKFTSEGSSELPDQFLYMLQNADYLLHDSNIYYQDHTGEKLNLTLLDVNINVENSFNNHDIKFSMNLPEAYGHDLAVVASLHGDINALTGDVFIEAHQLNIKQWNEKFTVSDEYQVNAILDVDLWLTLNKNNIQTLITQLAADDLSIRNKLTNKQWETEYLSTKLRYSNATTNDSENWNIAVSDFYFGNQSQPAWVQPVSIIASYDDEHYYLSADFLRIHDVQEIAEVFLSEKQLPDLDRLKSYQLQADIYNLSLQLPKEMSKQQLLKHLDMDVSILNLSMFDKENDVRLSGIDATLHYDIEESFIDVMTENAEVEIKKIFRGPLFAKTISGKLKLEHDEDNWRLSSSQLQLINSHIKTFSRLDIQLSSEGNVFVDVQTNFTDAYGKYARHYVPVGVMSPRLVDWLDMAVTDGYVPEGVFILQGNLNDFPYKEHDGVFQVLFSPENVNMQFLKDWPLLTDASATVKFNNLSLVVKNAKGKTQQASLSNGYAEILNLPDPHLTVSTDADGKNEDIQSYVWNSALDNILGDALRLFQFDGDSRLNLTLEVPLNKKKINVGIDGNIKFSNTEIYYPALGYGLSEVNGVVDFTEDSISADSMKAKMQDKIVYINAMTKMGDSGREVIFYLDGVMQADYLLQRYEWLPEDWVSGDSMWRIDIEIPYKPEDYLVHIKANSLLEGAAFQLSDQVKKRPDRKIRFSTEIDVLDNNGLQLVSKVTTVSPNGEENKASDLLDLFAVRDEDNRWNFDINSKFITGKGAFTEGLDKDTQIQLELENIDVYALFVSENNNKSQPLNPSDFPSLSWKAKKVIWDDLAFTNAKLETNWHQHGMLINTFSLTGSEMIFNAHGTWLTSWRGLHETVLQGSISSSNLGNTLVGLNFPRSLDRCDYTATFDSKWPAEPYRLSWANMNGQVSFEMYDGEILDVDPGAGGRLLGLLNIFKLTNRLSFDFDDVTRKGFAFDSIKGDFEFVNGDGSLKNFDVIAPAADINMFGSIGLLDQDYGLLMRVKPHTDSLTFAGGVLLGGVVVGVGLALIQKVFDLGVIGHNVYSITGGWDDPKVEQIIERTLSDDTEEDDF